MTDLQPDAIRARVRWAFEFAGKTPWLVGLIESSEEREGVRS
jgi:hypothetical protein